MRRHAAKFVALLFIAAGAASIATAQLSGLLPAQTVPQPGAASATTPPDPLGRETPHGTIVGFIRAAQEEKYSIAALYFQPASGHRHPSAEQQQELAEQLLAILNQRFGPFLDSVSRDPQGRLDDGLPADQESIAAGRGEASGFVVLLVRIEDERGRRLWYISQKTLDEVPKVYDSLRYPQLEKRLPKFLLEFRPLGVPLWQWLAVILLFPVSWLLAWPLLLLVRFVANRFFSSRDPGLAPISPIPKFGWGTFLLALPIHYVLVNFTGISLLYRQYYRRVVWIVLIFGFYWALTHVTKLIAERMGRELSQSGRMAERSLVSLARRLLNAFVFVMVGLIALSTIGVNVTTALAGLGIGGLAIGLGAQKTFENLLGGIAILTDRALQIGDLCRIGDQTGTVEDIGLRSTRLRTQDRTLVSIPNGTVATAVLENYRWRDKILCRQIIRLKYDLESDHLRYVLQQMRAVVDANPKIEPKTWRVRLLRFADYAYEVEVYAYVLERDYNAFLAVQEEMILKLIDAVEQAGTTVALPSQASIVLEDHWNTPERAKAALEAIKKQREPGAPGPHDPRFSPDTTPPKP
jgi:MscS family membrane protein